MKVNVESLKNNPLKYRYEFTVKPTLGRMAGNLPMDMLRYDACYPLHFNDEEVSVTLIHHDSNPKWYPTEARWNSFGWEVL